MISDKYTMIRFLYNINDLKNLKSIFQYGILSKNDLAKSKMNRNADISNPDVQKRRENKQIKNLSLHDYASLYFDARNPMMYYEIAHNRLDELCVICVDKRVLDLKDTIVSDRNGAAELALFDTPGNALKLLDFSMIFAQYWNDPNPMVKYMKKSKKCAEVLVLHKVPVEFLKMIKVGSEQAYMKVQTLHLPVPVEFDKNTFFQK